MTYDGSSFFADNFGNEAEAKLHTPSLISYQVKYIVCFLVTVFVRIETICQQTARKKLTELVTQVHYQEIRRLSTEWELDCQRCVDIPFIVTSYRYLYSPRIRTEFSEYIVKNVGHFPVQLQFIGSEF